MSNSINIEDLSELTKEQLLNLRVANFGAREEVHYQEIFKNLNGRELNEDEDMILIGEYGVGVITYSDDPNDWTKFYIIGDDIGDGLIQFYIKGNNIYLEKDSILLNEEYRELFIDILSTSFFGKRIEFQVDYRGLKG